MDDPNRDTPEAVRQAITAHGGLNPYGKPMWRVVLAQNRLSKKRGIWHTFADGRNEQFRSEGASKEGLVFSYNPLKATSVEYGVRETPRYGCRGWILEKWLAAECWLRGGWNDDAGPKPVEGDYWMLGGPWDELPQIHDLCQAISNWQREWDARPKDFEKAYAASLAEERKEEERRYRQAVEDLDHFMRSEIQPIFKSTSLEAQRVRNQAMEASGQSGHLGAGE